jgi:hypothetical protein
MIVSIHQPNFLPWLGYFHKIAESDVHVMLDNVQFGKNSFINRNRIKIGSGCMWLTVPVLTKGRFGENINNIFVDPKTKWQGKMCKSICINYSRAPFFKDYFKPLEDILKRPWEKLSELNCTLLNFLLDALNLKPRIVSASSLKIREKKSDLVFAICKELGAGVYFSGSHGKGYLIEDKFRENGIKVIYQDYRHPAYRQLFGDFVSHLSVIDLLFNSGPESLSILKKEQQKLKGGTGDEKGPGSCCASR